MKHWTENDLLHWLYTAEGDAAHLDECSDCRARAQQMIEIRKTTTADPEVSWDFLAAQRRSIYARLGRSGRSFAMRWAMAGASLLGIAALSLALLRPWTTESPALYNSADEKLFSDLASIEQSSEPRAIRPIHNLFKQ